MCHCSHADSPGWAKKKEKYPDFFLDPRNIVLMGCDDGANPWKHRSASLLFVVFAVWNLPPDIRMKRENIILLGVTDKKPKNSQLVYEVVVEQLLELWNPGVPAWDTQSRTRFVMRAMMMTALFDYPGLTDACMQPNEGSFAGCVKCSLQGLWLRGLKDVKYSTHNHENGSGPNDIILQRYTNAQLLAKAEHIEVSNTHNIRLTSHIVFPSDYNQSRM